MTDLDDKDGGELGPAAETNQGSAREERAASAPSTDNQTDPTASAAAAELSKLNKTKLSSREGSPIRLPPRFTSSSSSNQSSRSRNNSHELSPSRPSNQLAFTPSVPSAAAVQRALSVQRPQLPPPSVDGAQEASRSDRQPKSGNNSPSWPTSPRVRSPPPSITALRPTLGAIRKAESEPNTSIKRLAAMPSPELSVATDLTSSSKDVTATHSSLRAPSRGMNAQGSGLETVAEGSAPTTPYLEPLVDPLLKTTVEVRNGEESGEANKQPEQAKGSLEVHATAAPQPPKPNDDKPEQESKTKSAAIAQPGRNLAKRSLTSLTGNKSKNAIEPLRTMTVETETVSSIPQILGGERGLSGRDGSGSVRTKPSSETMKPKREKRKLARKPPSLHAGTVTSKADIFEAKVANAVDEADSSDSDETFVYESNPPEIRPSRHHSRTPSAASQASQMDQYGARNKSGARNGSQGVAGKKSMKFTTSSAFNNHLDSGNGTTDSVRSNNRNATPRHHHIGRYSRGHPSLFDTDSPFTEAGKASSPRTPQAINGRNSRPNSPRIGNGRFPGSPRKEDSFAYEGDDDGADDERVPLIGSVRINRNRHLRRPQSGTMRHIEYIERKDRSYCSRYGSCIVVTLMVFILFLGAGVFMIGLNRPLIDVSIRHIKNVLASEQEIMFDLDVKATNPNLFTITVIDLDVNVFADSEYAGSSAAWLGNPRNLSPSRMSSPRWRTADAESHMAHEGIYSIDGVDKGTDPDDDPDSGVQKLLLGRIFEFDSPLTFEASPLRRIASSSVGALRLAKPGNKTENGGSARWARVLHHPFDLIVRGVIEYQLPLSSGIKSAKIGGRVTVSPNDDDIDDGDDGGGGGDGDDSDGDDKSASLSLR